MPGGGSRWDTRFDHDRIRATLRAALTHTVNEDELISRNVAAMIRLPSGRVRKPRAWSVTEACQFLESARASSDPLYTGYVLMLVLGLRLGEMLGLPWANVNLEAAEVDVGWQLQRAGRHLYHRETKTPGSDAPLPLPSICAAAIKLQTEKQATWRHHAGQAWRDHGLVITTRYGTPYEPRNFTRHFARQCDAAGCATSRRMVCAVPAPRCWRRSMCILGLRCGYFATARSQSPWRSTPRFPIRLPATLCVGWESNLTANVVAIAVALGT